MDSRLVPWFALALVGLFWVQDLRVAESERELLTVQRDHAAQAADERAATIAAQRDQLQQLAQVGAKLEGFRQTLAKQGAAQAKQLQELKESDQTVALWLAGGVPAALGRLYAYPETTDPDEYSPVPADLVPAAGAGSAAGQ